MLLDWWGKHSYGRQCYIGLGFFRAGSNAAWKDKTQLPRQIEALRETPGVQGMIFFSSKSFEKNPLGWNDSLQNNYYKFPALVPPMNWLDTSAPMELFIHTKFNKQDSVMTVFLENKSVSDNLRGYVVYRSSKESFDQDSVVMFQVVPNTKDSKFILRTTQWQYKKGFSYFVTALNRLNIESKPVMMFSLFPEH